MNSFNCKRCGQEITWDKRSHLCPCAMIHGEVVSILTLYIPNAAKPSKNDNPAYRKVRR